MSLFTEPPAASLFADEQFCGERDASYDGPGIYARRHPQSTVLYKLIQDNLESWLRARREACPDDDPIPAYVEKTFRHYLLCGVMAAGFARYRCPDCGHDLLVAFSCKGRGVCPSCGQKYMVKTALHLEQYVLPRVPYRQWVISFPKRVRFFLQHDKKHFARVLAIVMRAIETKVRACAPGAPKTARLGAICFPQRFGASLNLHPHGHIIASSGLFALDGEGGLTFYQATLLTDDVIGELCQTIRNRVLRYLVRQGCLDNDDAEIMKQWDHQGGFSLDASVALDPDDRAGLERLCRYCARHPFAKGRLRRYGNDRVVYQLPKPDLHGQTELLLEPLALLDKLAELILPPRMHRNRYWGAFAPNSKLRPFVVLSAGAHQPPAETDLSATPTAIRKSDVSDPSSPPTPDETNEKPKQKISSWWALCIAKIYEVLPILCTRCGTEMKLCAFITEPAVLERILVHIGQPPTIPKCAPARDPPQAEFAFDDPDTAYEYEAA